MAANAGNTNSTGRKNYYNLSYGMLSTNAKEAPEGFEKMSLSEIKSRRTKNENVDLRNKYYDSEKGGDYPLRVFYTDITGIIEGIEKDEYSQGVSLKVTLHDQDGDESILQTDFYGKIAADFLNRLLNVDPTKELNFRPYSIPTSAEINGNTVNFYNAGVSIKDGDTKTERAYKRDNGLPDSEQVKNSKGKDETSRVKQIDFLWEKVLVKFADINADSTPKETPAKKESAPATASAPAGGGSDDDHDDLPF